MKLILGGCLMAVIPVIVLGSISIYNSKTSIEKETNQQILMISKSIADMDCFKKAMQGLPHCETVIISEKTNEPVCTIVCPVRDENDQVIGVVAGFMKVTFLAARINAPLLAETTGKREDVPPPLLLSRDSML